MPLFVRAAVEPLFIGFVLSLALYSVLAAANFNLLHWFALPVILCGMSTARDAWRWFRAELDAFDPVGILGLVGFHFFFLAPLLHVYWDVWMVVPSPPADWRDWLGAMATLNYAGLLCYRHVLRRFDARGRSAARCWSVNRVRFGLITAVLLSVSAAAQIQVVRMYGGVAGYIDAAGGQQPDAFANMGAIFVLSEALPLLLVMGFVVGWRNREWARNAGVILSVLVVCIAAKFLFGGLRGSRSTTVWTLFYATCLIHFSMRRISRSAVVIGLAALVTFMYFYGFYKAAGRDAVDALRSSDARALLVEQTGRSLKATLLHDFGRSDVQAYLLYRTIEHADDYDYAWGGTYLYDAAVVIPRALWPERPAGKVRSGTELQYGRGSYVEGAFASSRVYGVAGEALLNFTPFAVPFAFVMLGVLVGWVRSMCGYLQADDARWLLMPLLVNLCLVVLIGDGDNVAVYLVRNGAIPGLVVWMTSTARRRLPQPVTAIPSTALLPATPSHRRR